jgi:transposase
MSENIAITTERVDDLPVLLAQEERMRLAGLLDEHFPCHGNWQGLSPGEVTTVWLAHILNEGDHRLNHVQRWVEQRLETIIRSLGQPVRALDWSDDRLAGVLDLLSDDDRWVTFERALNQQVLRVYDLTPQRVRVDSTTASGYWTVTEDGLFQLGHSKDHRPDLPQVKVMLSALDPLGLPVATQVVAGQRADDPLYLPAIRQVQASLGRHGLLYVGDCKMAALETRAFVAAHNDYYLTPLSEKQLPPAELERYLQAIWAREDPQLLTPVVREREGQTETIAEGYERSVPQEAVVDGQTVTWTERRLVVRSLAQARAREAALRTRLQQALAAVAALNVTGRGKRRYHTVAELRPEAEAVLRKYRVSELVQLTYTETRQEKPRRRYRDRPADVQVETTVQVGAQLDEVAVAETIKRLGWRVYATNQPATELPLAQAVLAYREEYLVERGFGRLKGRMLSLSPVYLQEDHRVTGLIRLLTLGLRVLTLLEWQVRRRLAAQQEKLAGLYAGNPKRATARPTAETLLEAFKYVTLTVIQMGDQVIRHLTPLSALQQRILDLLDLPLDIYTKLTINCFGSP